MTKQQKLGEKAAAIANLKEHIHEGDTIYTITRHRSASGMYRAIDCYTFHPQETIRLVMAQEVKKIEVTRLRHTWSIAAALGYRYDKKHEAIGVGGCGFDAASQIVSDLARELFGNGTMLRKEEI